MNNHKQCIDCCAILKDSDPIIMKMYWKHINDKKVICSRCQIKGLQTKIEELEAKIKTEQEFSEVSIEVIC